ncbi:MAG: hypothetical protein J0I41_19615 [Filimonas sp.]|nr:hypothetical protein [Filimonas sp.]
MKQTLIILVIISCITFVAFTNDGQQTTDACGNTLAYIKKEALLFAGTTAKLEETVSEIDSLQPQTLANAKAVLAQSRQQYKRMEFFLFYFLRSATLVYNEANKYEVEEPFIEAREPSGFQVMESILFSENAVDQKKELIQQANLVNTSAEDIRSLLYNLDITDRQILESIRIELIRLITLGITGFDAPELKTGIAESKQVLLAFKDNLVPFLHSKNKEADSIRFYLSKAVALCDTAKDFDSFDRMNFLVNAALPLQHHLDRFIKESGLELNTTGTLNYDTDNLFSKNALVLSRAKGENKALIKLGRMLFFEKRLSQNNTRSCASCHQPEKYFSDGLSKSTTLDGGSFVQRNAPSLYYSTYQYAQFWDGRVKTLKDQIQAVLDNPMEMGSDHKIAIRALYQSKTYPAIFKTVFAQQQDTLISISTISGAITAFFETLAPMDSPFDQYIKGDKNALSKTQIKGFNLFMGKAQCGTCHYAPLFNGLIPPLYQRTELEVLGLTKNDNFASPENDEDEGRYTSYPVSYYKFAFKTPTVRNVEKTAPYMHNGNFATLESVMEFYNKGGAAGMGLEMPTQTLSAKPLNLTEEEIAAIISFLHSLTDKPIN